MENRRKNSPLRETYFNATKLISSDDEHSNNHRDDQHLSYFI